MFWSDMYTVKEYISIPSYKVSQWWQAHRYILLQKIQIYSIASFIDPCGVTVEVNRYVTDPL